jgi:hypothetical protein
MNNNLSINVSQNPILKLITMKIFILCALGPTEILLVFFLIALIVLPIVLIMKSRTIESKLKRAKKMYDKQLISLEEYDKMKAKLIEKSKI